MEPTVLFCKQIIIELIIVHCEFHFPAPPTQKMGWAYKAPIEQNAGKNTFRSTNTEKVTIVHERGIDYCAEYVDQNIAT